MSGIVAAFEDGEAAAAARAPWRTVRFSYGFFGSALSQRALEGLDLSDFLHVSVSVVVVGEQLLVGRVVGCWVR